MNVLVTGADGFVGAWLVPELRARGHVVTAAVRLGGTTSHPWLDGVSTCAVDVADPASVDAMFAATPEAVVHLAAVASGGDARRDPAEAWRVNVAGTALVAEGAARSGSGRLLLASTAEVYGVGPEQPRVETDSVEPCSTYAASKLAAEVALLAVGRRTGLEAVVARSFPHTGRGQDLRFVVPAFARRLVEAKRAGQRRIAVGNLAPVRDLLHVSDVVRAYADLLAAGIAGEVYNVAAGRAVSIGELLGRLARLVDWNAEPVADPELVRTHDIPYLVGDAAKLEDATGWEPRVSLEETLAEVVNAQTD